MSRVYGEELILYVPFLRSISAVAMLITLCWPTACMRKIQFILFILALILQPVVFFTFCDNLQGYNYYSSDDKYDRRRYKSNAISLAAMIFWPLFLLDIYFLTVLCNYMMLTEVRRLCTGNPDESKPAVTNDTEIVTLHRQAPNKKGEMYEVLAPMATDLGLPDQKVDEYVKVFEEHEVYTRKALHMLPEDEINNIIKDCKMRIPAEMAMKQLWRQDTEDPPPPRPAPQPPRPEVDPGQPTFKRTTTTIGKQKAVEYRYYSRLNLLRSEVVGDNAKNQVQVAWQLAFRYAQANKGDPKEAMNVNNAKKCLSDPAAREDYNNALDVYGLEDGRHKDP